MRNSKVSFSLFALSCDWCSLNIFLFLELWLINYLKHTQCYVPHRSGASLTIIIQPIFQGEVVLLQELFWRHVTAENPATHGLLGCFLYKIWRFKQDRQPCGILGKGNLNITVELTEYFHLLSQAPAICHATDKNCMWSPAVLKHILPHAWPHEEHLGLWWSTYCHMRDHMRNTYGCGEQQWHQDPAREKIEPYKEI